MSSMLRTRFGIPGVIATIALLFAMTGGAFAAKYLITSTKQISPSVLKKLKGAAGPAGPAGAAGIAGAQGPAGPAGANGKDGAPGSAGATGAAGKSVTAEDIGPFGACGEQEGVKLKSASGENFVCDGTEGAKGDDGEPWVAGTAPSDVVMKGAWSAHSSNAALDERIPVAISLTVPIDGSELNADVIPVGGPDPGELCLGTAKDPAPAEIEGVHLRGLICVYEQAATGFGALPGASEPAFSSSGGPVFYLIATGGLANAYGSWAMYTP